jgi:hypothetical protein
MLISAKLMALIDAPSTSSDEIHENAIGDWDSFLVAVVNKERSAKS